MGFSFLSLGCPERGQAEYMLSEMHERIYSNYYAAWPLAYKQRIRMQRR